MLGSLGWEELLLILLILGLVFGASRVAELGGALGRGVREFRREVQQDEKPAPDAEAPSTDGPSDPAD